MAQLFAIIGVPLPPTPPYKLAGHLNHAGDVWTFRKFAGTVGRSDLAGDFSVDRGQKPQMITADLVSRNLDMKDLGGFVGADRGEKPSPKPPPGDRVLPQEPFSLEKLRVANANVKFRGEQHPHREAAARENDRDAQAERRRAHARAAQFRRRRRQPRVADHDGRAPAVIKTRADIAVKQLHLDKLFPTFKLSKANAGSDRRPREARYDRQLDGENARRRERRRGAHHGRRLGERAPGAALEPRRRAHAPVLLTGDKQVPVRCMVTQLKGTNGDFVADPFVLDTGKAVVTGTGDINFADEKLNLRLVSKPKDFSLAALRGPINVTGTFKNPIRAPRCRPSRRTRRYRGRTRLLTGGLGP